jgi:hypothetical protein
MTWSPTGPLGAVLLCPCCMDDMRLVQLSFDLRLLWYYCPICTFKLPDESIYRAAPTSKM